MAEKYNRSRIELEEKACKWWPDNLVEMEAESSIIPTLVRTQDKFISILTLAKAVSPKSVFDLIEASDFPANLFLKHLMVLTDFGSEPLQRINRDFAEYFPKGEIKYALDGNEITYKFCSLPVRGTLNNKKMKTDVDGLKNKESIEGIYKDLFILLLFGANCLDDKNSSIFAKCVVGSMMGKSDELKQYIKQRYIFVSRIIGGAQANGLGNVAQAYAERYLKTILGEEYSIKSNGHIPGVTQNDRTETTFDLSVEHNGHYIGVEISFQVTTNSTIERKAGQAKARYEAVEHSGNHIAYIIDGAGNFQRVSALQTICEYSHCTIAYTEEEFDILVKFIKEKIG